MIALPENLQRIEFNAENIISAASVGIALNIGLKKIENGINNVKVIDGRMEVFKTSGNKNIVVDFRLKK